MKRVIIAKYTEDTSWSDTLFDSSWTVSVYDKSTTYTNVGREAETFLRYVCDIYDDVNPDDRIVFLQGNPFDHVTKEQLQRHIDTDYEHVTAVNGVHFVSDGNGHPHHPGLPVREKWLSIFPHDTHRKQWSFSPGAQYTLRGSHVLQFPKTFWETLHARAFDENVCAWTLERFWYAITHESSHHHG